MTSVDPSSATHPALWEMALIHRIFRTSLAELAAVVPTVAPDDRARVDAVAAHLRFMLDGLTAHHATEDDLVWPALHARAELSGEALARMEAQHRGIHDRLDELRRQGATWSARPTPGSADTLAEAITDLLTALTEHLDEEERDVVPLIAEHLSEEEWAQVGRTAFAKFTPEQRFVALGQMLEVATPAEAAAMLATLPAPVKLLWALVGKRRYRRYVTELRRP